MTSFGHPGLVLVGGLAMSALDYAPLVAALRRRGVETLVFDNLHVGDGPRLTTPLTIAAQAEHAWRQVDAAGMAAADLFGLSMGGMIAATMATMRSPRVRSLTLAATAVNSAAAPAVSPAFYAASIGAATAEAVCANLAPAFGRTAHATQPAVVQAYYDYRLAKGNKQSRRDFVAQLDSIRDFPGDAVYDQLASLALAPLVISGDEDRLFAAPHGAEVARRACAREHRVLAKRGHMLHLEDPEALADLLAVVSRDGT